MAGRRSSALMAIPSNAHLNYHPFIGYCRHQDLILGAPLIINYVDFGVVNGVTGLFAWPTARYPFPPALEPKRGGALATGFPMEGRGTDATFIVPHVPVVPPTAYGPLFALIVLFGSSRILMGSNRSRIWCRGMLLDGEAEQQVGCCVFPYIPFSLNLQCWDFASKKLDMISAPVMSDLVIAPNTVQVGVEFSDYLFALLDWALDVALAVLFAFGSKRGSKWWSNRKAGKLAKANKVADEAYEKAIKEGLSEEAAKAA